MDSEGNPVESAIENLNPEGVEINISAAEDLLHRLRNFDGKDAEDPSERAHLIKEAFDMLSGLQEVSEHLGDDAKEMVRGISSELARLRTLA